MWKSWGVFFLLPAQLNADLICSLNGVTHSLAAASHSDVSTSSDVERICGISILASARLADTDSSHFHVLFAPQSRVLNGRKEKADQGRFDRCCCNQGIRRGKRQRDVFIEKVGTQVVWVNCTEATSRRRLGVATPTL